MKIEHEFSVQRPPQAVWDFFQQVPAVADCLPGAELTDTLDDGTYKGSVTTKLGPMTARFVGKAKVDPNPTTMSATMEGRGVDRSGGSQGGVTVTYQILPSDTGTTVKVAADVTLTGAIAQFGRSGLVNEVSNRLIGEFVKCLEGKLAATSEAEAAEVKAGDVKGVSLFLASLWSWLRSHIRRLSRRRA